jgi:hypothetical protein
VDFRAFSAGVTVTLPEFIAANAQRPFVWGEWDCILFASAWAQHKTGADYLAGLPAWNNERQALRAIRLAGGLAKALDDRLKRIHPNLANDGDVGMLDGRIAIFSGPHLVGPAYDGLIFVDRTKAQCAWSF